MKYLSNQLLDDLYSKTESGLEKAIREWQQLPEAQLTQQPAPGKWSAAQCLEHLNSYGHYYLPAIEKAIRKVSGAHPSVHFKSSWLGNYFYKLMLPAENGLPAKMMKSPAKHAPASSLNGKEVLNEFISQLEKLEQLLTKARNININKASVGISIMPLLKLKLGDVFLFIVAHNTRHLLQAERALKSWNHSPDKIQQTSAMLQSLGGQSIPMK